MALLNPEMYSKEDIILKLDLLDIYCEMNKTSGELLMVGGSALLISLELKARTFRPTRDIDLKILSSSDEKALIRAIQEANLDLIVGTIEVPPTEDFIEMEKYELDVPTLQNIKVYVPTMEMLACTKLFSKRQKDLDDLMETPILELCDQEVLYNFVKEYKDYVINPEHYDWNFHKLNDIYAQKGL